MHAAREPLVVGDPLQKLTELALFIDGKGREQGFLMFACNSTDGLQGNAPFFRGMERIAATVLRIVAAFNQSTGFQLVHQGHKAAGKHAQNAGKRLLCKRSALAQYPENAGMRGS